MNGSESFPQVSEHNFVLLSLSDRFDVHLIFQLSAQRSLLDTGYESPVSLIGWYEELHSYFINHDVNDYESNIRHIINDQKQYTIVYSIK